MSEIVSGVFFFNNKKQKEYRSLEMCFIEGQVSHLSDFVQQVDRIRAFCPYPFVNTWDVSQDPLKRY